MGLASVTPVIGAAPLLSKSSSYTIMDPTLKTASERGVGVNSWRNDACVEMHRRYMRKAVALIIRERQRVADDRSGCFYFEQRVRALERILFKSSASFGEYLDRTSLRCRLRKATEQLEHNESAKPNTTGATPADISIERRRRERQIFKLLEERFKQSNAAIPNSTLLQMSQRLEVSLFRKSLSYEEYVSSQGDSLRRRILALLDDCLTQRARKEGSDRRRPQHATP